MAFPLPWHFHPRGLLPTSMYSFRYVALGVFVVLLGPVVGAQPAERVAWTSPKTSEPLARGPRSANPYLAFLPAGATPDYAYWNAWLADAGKARESASPAARRADLVYDETETSDARGQNDTFETAEVVGGVGTGAGLAASLTIRGTSPDFSPSTPTVVGPFDEEDGALPFASDTGLKPGEAIRIEGATIGDGAYGETSGDFDVYAVTVPEAGLLLRADTDTPESGELDTILLLLASNGAIVAANDDEGEVCCDSALDVYVDEPGTYYLIVGSYSTSLTNLADPASGTGVETTGTYDLEIALFPVDLDLFAFDLRAGDVVGVGEGSASLSRVTLLSPDGELQIGSNQDISGIFPLSSPLPGGGNALATAVLVVPATGRYRLAVDAAGPYEVGVRVFRPRLEADADVERQTIFVDFDGATIPADNLFGGKANASLSPLASFMAGFGLSAADEGALIDAILANLEENLRSDLLAVGPNATTDVILLNSRDNADPGVGPGVTRLIIGGTIEELGVETIGIASSIDPGNFDLDDTAVVLLDLLAGPANDPNSLAQFGVAAESSRLKLVAEGIGNIAAHEAGHFLGLFHTDQFNDVPNLIDQGGNLPNTVGVGADLIFGTADDVDVDFVADRFVEDEGLLGVEDGTSSVAFALSTRLPVAVEAAPTSVSLRAWPNPVVAGAEVRIAVGAAPEARLAVLDVLGRTVTTARVVVGPTGDAVVSTAGFAPGTYLVRVIRGDRADLIPFTVAR